MKRIQTAFQILALCVLAAGCASNNLLDKENVAVAAGFKIIMPHKPNQEALLKKLPPDKLTPITLGGKPYYILPDAINNEAYIGGPKQFQAYKKLRQKQKKDSEDYVAPSYPIRVDEVDTMDWGDWDGWGPFGPLGEPGWY
jgi:hypothetical protein